MLFIWQIILVGQSSKPVSLEEVVIYGNKIPKGEVGINTTFVDSLLLSQNVGGNFAELFREIGAGQMRSYGPSGLTTPSFRGTSGSQISVLWNGIVLNSSLNGAVDISQIPIILNNQSKVKIQKGGASSLYGSGAIGGTIQLDSYPAFNNQTTASFTNEIGSFGRHLYQLHLGISSSRENISTIYYHRIIQNNFPYINKYNRPIIIEKRTNARYLQSGLSQNIDFRIGKNQTVGLKLWVQTNEYEVPNSILANNKASGNQRDETIRSLVHWSYEGRTHSFSYKQAFIHHHLHFTDPSAQIDSKTTYGTWTNRFESTYEVTKRISFLLGANYLYEYTGEENFGSDPINRNTISLFGTFKFKPTSKTSFALNIRQEKSDKKWAPITPSLGVKHKFNSLVSVQGNISKNYRLPTFNDLYWKGVGGFGNSSLLPESSWGGEVTVDLLREKTSKYTFKVTGYSHSVDNWILWRPVSIQEWSPDNVKKVWTRGLELDASFKRRINIINLILNTNYRFTKTTNNQTSSDNFIREQGKQLSYTPIHEFNQSITLNANRYTIQIRYNYVDRQFSESENKEIFALPAYNIWNTSIEYSFSYKKLWSKLYVKVNNIFDTPYENRRGYPMYGRNFSLGTTIQIQSIK